MRILLVHNRYQQRGGEDIVFESERGLLLERGHSVLSYERHNDEIKEFSLSQKLGLVRDTVWSRKTISDLVAMLEDHQADLAHFYNTFPLVSPAAYQVCQERGVRVVQTLPNFRLVCPGAQLMRERAVCELCVGCRVPWRGILHRCYRNSAFASSVVTSMLVFHRMRGTWLNDVDTFFALTEFAKAKFIEGGLPASKIVVKPNFLSPDPGGHSQDDRFGLFVGRLSREKGVATLLKAWRALDGVPLKIAGTGPMEDAVAAAVDGNEEGPINWLGWMSREEVIGLMKRATFLIVPSEWYEGFPLTIVEALACGTPVVGSNIGGVGEIVKHDVSGLHFEPGDPEALAAAVRKIWANPELRNRLSRGARLQFESSYTAGANYTLMMGVFERLTAGRQSTDDRH